MQHLRGLMAEAQTMTTILRRRKPQGCDLCGDVKELRPYGPNGEWVCFQCGMKDEAAAKRAFQKRLDQDESQEGRQAQKT